MPVLPLILILTVLALLNLLLLLRKSRQPQQEENYRLLIRIEAELARLGPLLREELSRNRDEQQKGQKVNRDELSQSLRLFEERFGRSVKELGEGQNQRMSEWSRQQERLQTSTEDKLREIRETVAQQLRQLQSDNALKLEQMRQTVDEKLQETVEKRFNTSFKLISERLEQVHKGLGEMQSLASGVGDLKKVLGNVKTRGNLGEIRLGAILEQILSPEQYAQNVAVKERSQERVEFAIKLPGRTGETLWLPIDSKFPTEDYQRLTDAYEHPQAGAHLEMVSRQFEAAVKKNARDIRDKYIAPPHTTDFAIMFVPTEGLYAEILRRPGLFEFLQREYRISVVGPANLVAFLSSLQMGFRTLAIEKRSGEVWEILGGIKTEFGRFGMILEKTKKKLQEASHVIDEAGVRSRAIERKLRDVEALPSPESETTEEP